MSNSWQYQLRIDLADGLAAVARRDPDDPTLRPLAEVLRRHDTTLKCQFDAFADYVTEAERHGGTGYPLYRWAKATIDDPVKRAQLLQSFTLYVNGQQSYPAARADVLEADLQPLGGGTTARLARYDINPENNCWDSDSCQSQPCGRPLRI
jgi:hypothetical protein